MVQTHLTYKEMTDFGCFYTPDVFVQNLIDKIKYNISNYEDYFYVDSSCGYGSFLRKLENLKTIGCDIDKEAIDVATANDKSSNYYCLNSLSNFSRNSINLQSHSKIIIIGNPPYNDTTSKVKNEFKNQEPCAIDADLKTRDLGISFMLSFNKLNADYVAVLHPLSYMIKKANYDLLKPFYSNYSLIDHSIVNSQSFSFTSKTKGFPIIVALYQRSPKGMTYPEILDMQYKTIDGETFHINYDSIRNYISKYPSKYAQPTKNDILFFTMRDINALNRSRTFIEDYGPNAIVINKSKFEYYCYVDVFKRYIEKLPYYYGNIDVFIDNEKFKPIKDVFMTNSVERYPWLKSKGIKYTHNNDYSLIDNYFSELFDKSTTIKN